MQKVFLDRNEATVFLNEIGLPIAKATLQKYATIGGGPKYSIFGKRAVYRFTDLEDWVQEVLGEAVSSTSEREKLQ